MYQLGTLSGTSAQMQITYESISAFWHVDSVKTTKHQNEEER